MCFAEEDWFNVDLLEEDGGGRGPAGDPASSSNADAMADEVVGNVHVDEFGNEIVAAGQGQGTGERDVPAEGEPHVDADVIEITEAEVFPMQPAVYSNAVGGIACKWNNPAVSTSLGQYEIQRQLFRIWKERVVPKPRPKKTQLPTAQSYSLSLWLSCGILILICS